MSDLFGLTISDGALVNMLADSRRDPPPSFGMLGEHVLDYRLQLASLRVDDAPEDDIADALVFVPKLVADGADGMPRRIRISGEPVLWYPPNGLGDDENGI